MLAAVTAALIIWLVPGVEWRWPGDSSTQSTPTASTVVIAESATGGRPVVTINEFLPEDRGLGECISAIPKPGCGSEARGGWRQSIVLVVILAGLGVIAWRVFAGARKARPPVPRS